VVLMPGCLCSSRIFDRCCIRMVRIYTLIEHKIIWRVKSRRQQRGTPTLGVRQQLLQ
jgi:hypothetical protein